MSQITLHPTLSKDCQVVTELSASTVLLMNDAQYPWLILVPNRPDLTDLDQLSTADMVLVQYDIRRACKVLRQLFSPTKLNVASLGNMVPQLHIHVIARFDSDPAWPKPVWGVLPAKPYTQEALQQSVQQLKQAFDEVVD
ncbi:HIT family protein [Magnetococcus sp. PR-3]|uniref:HIT family protein n=1 Tax=Magnetococcus sp. PR-3 TaxID=3120355 RepID=UPI002FCE2267